MGGNGLLCAPAPLDVRTSCSPDRAQVPSRRRYALPHRLSLPSCYILFVSPRDSSWRIAAECLSVVIVHVLPSLRGKWLLWRVCGKATLCLPQTPAMDRQFSWRSGQQSVCNKAFAAKTRSCQDRSLWSWRNCLWPHIPHNDFTHTTLSHTALSHATLSHNLSSTISTLLTHTHTHTFSHTHTALSHTPFPHNLLTQTTLSHTTLSHTTLSHTTDPSQLSLAHNYPYLFHTICLPPSLRNSHTHTFSHTTCCHTQPSHKKISYTQLSHTYLFHTFCLPPNPQNSHILFQIHSINLLTHNLLTRNSLTRSVFRHLLSLSCLSHPIFTFLVLLIGRSWHVGLSGPLISHHFLNGYSFVCFFVCVCETSA